MWYTYNAFSSWALSNNSSWTHLFIQFLASTLQGPFTLNLLIFKKYIYTYIYMSGKYTVVCGETQWNITAPTNIMKHVLRLILVKGLENIDSIITFFDKKTLMELMWFCPQCLQAKRATYSRGTPCSFSYQRKRGTCKGKILHRDWKRRERENLADLC